MPEVGNVALARRVDDPAITIVEMVTSSRGGRRDHGMDGFDPAFGERVAHPVDHRPAIDLVERLFDCGVETGAAPATHHQCVHAITPAWSAATRAISFVAPKTSPLTPPRFRRAHANTAPVASSAAASAATDGTNRGTVAATAGAASATAGISDRGPAALVSADPR